MKAIIVGARDSGEKNNPHTLTAAALAKGVQAQTIYLEDLLFDIATSQTYLNQEFDHTDLVAAVNWYKSGKLFIYRDIAYSLALYLNHKQVPFWNSEMLLQRSTTKLSCMQQLALEGLPIPPTLFSLNGQRLLAAALQKYSFPMVVKSVRASRGRDNHLVKDKTELEALLATGELNHFMVQPFIANEYDLRILCFGGRPSLVLKRQRTDLNTHLNNTSQGATAEWLSLSELPKELLTQCEKICTLMGREMAGIDMIPSPTHPQAYLCLEVNALPQITSGTDVPRKLEAFADSLKR